MKSQPTATPVESGIEDALRRGDHGDACTLLIAHSRDLLQPGKIARLRGFLAALPRESFLSHPKLLLISANAEYLSGELTAARRYLDSAIPLFRKARDNASLSAAYRYLAYIHQDMGENAAAIAACKKGLARLSADDFRGRAGLLSAMAGSHWRLLDHRRARLVYGQVMDIYLRAGDKEGQVRTLANASAIPLSLGYFAEARRQKEEVLRYYRDSDNRRSYCLAAINLSAVYLAIRELDKAEALLTDALAEARQIGLGMALGPARLHLGIIQTLQGRYPEAGETLQAALEETHAAGERSYSAAVGAALAQLHCLRGEPGKARRAAIAAIESASRERPLDSADARLALALALTDERDFRRALGELAVCSRVYERYGLVHRQALCLLAKIDIAARRSALKAAGMEVRRASVLCQRHGYDFLFDPAVKPNYWELLGQLLSAGFRTDYFEGLSDKYRSAGTPAATVAARVNVLGPLEVWRGDTKIDRWKRSTARSVLGFLAAKALSAPGDRRAAVPSDVLKYLLCPGKPERDASITLQVAVSELRRVFEPGLKEGRDSRYVRSDNDGYWIDLSQAATDAAEFQLLLRQGQQAEFNGQPRRALECYRPALALYRGDFLDGADSTEVEGVRESFRQQFFRAALAAARITLDLGRAEPAAELARRVIAADRTHEEAHRVLMRCFAAQNRLDLVLKQYQYCRVCLRKDLGLHCSRETDDLKQRLTGGL